jgi:hypothetical protein
MRADGSMRAEFSTEEGQGAYRERVIFHRDDPSYLCYHTWLRVGRYIWRGKRPTLLAPLCRPQIGAPGWSKAEGRTREKRTGKEGAGPAQQQWFTRRTEKL